ncbi:MAG: hypothetical protein JNL36_07810 [Candidatus Kapabacteria bacterium]|nr:hypothetical protein [Candidatus Kapabacteria bacterium]
MSKLTKTTDSMEKSPDGKLKATRQFEELHQSFPVAEIERLHDIDEKLATRAFDVWENAVNHFIEQAKKEANSADKFISKNINTQRFRIFLAFLLTLGGGYITQNLILNGHDISGSIVGGTTFLALIGLFIKHEEIRKEAKNTEGKKK